MSRCKILGALTLTIALISSANIADAKKSDKVVNVLVDCAMPNSSLQDEIDASYGPTRITFSGVCVGDLSIAIDDLTLRGETIAATIDGQINVNGARRLTLDGFTLTGATSGNTGIVAFDGAAVRVTSFVLNGDIGGGDFVENAVAAFHGSVVRIFESTVMNVQNGVLAFGGSVAEVRSASEIELFTNTGVSSQHGSSIRILDSTVTLQNGSHTGVSAGRHSILTVQNSVVTANGTSVNGADHAIEVTDSASARIENSTIVANNDLNSNNTAINVSEGYLRLRGVNIVANNGGGFSLSTRASNVQQDVGHTELTGPAQFGEMSRAQFQDVTIYGDVAVFENSLIRLRNRSGNDNQDTVDGDVDLRHDSALTFTAFGGGLSVRITGDLTCADGESSVGGFGGALVVAGTDSCSGF